MKKIEQKIYQYTAVFEPDKDRGGYTVTIPALPGCNSEGDSFEEALDNIKEAAGLYLEVMNERHEKIFDEDSVIVAPVKIRV